MNDLTEYMNGAIERILNQTLKFSFNNLPESAFFLKFIYKQKEASKRRKTFGSHIPSFLIASIASQCNLRCKGCYARANGICGSDAHREELSTTQWDDIFRQAAQLGIPFILLAGGEPLTRRDILQNAARHPDIVFPVFTNGTMFDEEYTDLFYKSRNLIPVFSLEGGSSETDERRGDGVYALVDTIMRQMHALGIYYGTSITVTTMNIEKVTGSAFLSSLDENGCKLTIFVEYVPIESDQTESEQAQKQADSLAPTDTDRALLAARLKDLRKQFPNMIFLSFPGDEEKLGGCLAAGRGFFHINATGAAEPCPFSPYSDCNLKDHTLLEALQSPLFRELNRSGLLQDAHTGGCVLYEKREEVKKISGQENT